LANLVTGETDTMTETMQPASRGARWRGARVALAFAVLLQGCSAADTVSNALLEWDGSAWAPATWTASWVGLWLTNRARFSPDGKYCLRAALPPMPRLLSL
jgi:hypothetical protein